MKFADIERFTTPGYYEINMPLNILEEKIYEWKTNSYYNLILNPDFQRGHVWTTKQQMKYVEFFLKGGITGRIIYFNKPSWNKLHTIKGYDDFVCIDGLQRITALLKFLKGELKVFKKYIEEYEDGIICSQSSMDLKFNINDLDTKEKVLIWYIQINPGGTVHTKKDLDRVHNLLKEEQEKKCE